MRPTAALPASSVRMRSSDGDGAASVPNCSTARLCAALIPENRVRPDSRALPTRPPMFRNRSAGVNTAARAPPAITDSTIDHDHRPPCAFDPELVLFGVAARRAPFVDRGEALLREAGLFGVGCYSEPSDRVELRRARGAGPLS